MQSLRRGVQAWVSTHCHDGQAHGDRLTMGTALSSCARSSSPPSRANNTTRCACSLHKPTRRRTDTDSLLVTRLAKRGGAWPCVAHSLAAVSSSQCHVRVWRCSHTRQGAQHGHVHREGLAAHSDLGLGGQHHREGCTASGLRAHTTHHATCVSCDRGDSRHMQASNIVQCARWDAAMCGARVWVSSSCPHHVCPGRRCTRCRR